MLQPPLPAPSPPPHVIKRTCYIIVVPFQPDCRELMTVFMGTSNADTASLPGTGEMPGTGGVEARFTTTRRRWLQLGLAAIWVIDGLLQYQGYMFTKSFATQILAPTAQGNPAWISDSILWAARIMEANQVPANAAFATLQLFIGLAIAYRRTLKPALVASVIWSLLV